MSSSKLGYVDRRRRVPLEAIDIKVNAVVAEKIGSTYFAESSASHIGEMNQAVRNVYYNRLDEEDHGKILEIVKRFDSQHYPEKKGLGIKGLGKSGVLELLAKLGIWLNEVDGAQDRA